MKDKSAFPFTTQVEGWSPDVEEGMTLREHYAGLAMQGCLAHPNCTFGVNDIAKLGIDMADALIKELEKE